jgi:hypothetical protein
MNISVNSKPNVLEVFFIQKNRKSGLICHVPIKDKYIDFIWFPIYFLSLGKGTLGQKRAVYINDFIKYDRK